MWLSHCCFYVMRQNDGSRLLRPERSNSQSARGNALGMRIIYKSTQNGQKRYHTPSTGILFCHFVSSLPAFSLHDFRCSNGKKHWFAEALSEGISLSSRLFFHAYQMFFIKNEDDTEKIGIFAHNYKCNHNEKKPNPYTYEHIGAVSKSAIV